MSSYKCLETSWFGRFLCFSGKNHVNIFDTDTLLTLLIVVLMIVTRWTFVFIKFRHLDEETPDESLNELLLELRWKWPVSYLDTFPSGGAFGMRKSAWRQKMHVKASLTNAIAISLPFKLQATCFECWRFLSDMKDTKREREWESERCLLVVGWRIVRSRTSHHSHYHWQFRRKLLISRLFNE